MKRMVFAAVFAVLFAGVAATGFAQTATLDVALSAARVYIEGALPAGSRVLISDLAAPNGELGAYAASELSQRLVNGRRVTVVERSAAVMQTLAAETDLQLSGMVSDATIAGIGHQTGAEVIVTGSITGAGDRFRISLNLTSVRTAELVGQYSAFFQPDAIVTALLAERQPVRQRPDWIWEPLSARLRFEAGGSITVPSVWYYDVGISNRAASEQLARTRARQNVQQSVAENIASDIRARIDITSFSMFDASGIEDAEFRIQTALTNSIRTRVPSFEVLEWHIETGETGGRQWYMAFVLVRFPRQDIITVVERMEPAPVVETVIQQMNLSPSESEKMELIRQMEEVRQYILEVIGDMEGGR